MYIWPFVSLVIFSPILGGLAMTMVGGDKSIIERNSKHTSLFTTFITFLFSLLLFFKVNPETTSVQMEERIDILPNFFINYVVGVDNINILFIVLTAFICFVITIFNFYYESDKSKFFYIFLLLLEGTTIGAFASQNLMLFFLFFEATLIPLFMIIGLKADQQEKENAFKYALVSMFSAMIILPAILIIVFRTGTGYLPELSTLKFVNSNTKLIWWLLFIGFAIRLPILPFQSWYLNILKSSNILVIMFVSSILSKLGIYAIFKINISLFPYISYGYSKIIVFIAIISSLYALLLSVKEKYIIKKIGCISMVCVNISLFSLFIISSKSLISGIFYSLTSSIFIVSLLVVYIIIETKEDELYLDKLHGYYYKMPILSYFHLFTLSSIIGIPFTTGFVSLMLLMTSTFEHSFVYGLYIILLLVVVSYIVMRMHSKVFWSKKDNSEQYTLNIQSILFIVFICLFVILIGIIPNTIINPIENIILPLVSVFKEVGA
ncbi:MAG: proton-conducting transporter membrane subunit [Alphaproteobacteria bacterium]|nr:proton-conducting transporter membrane subunit [Alphaproteobacteria bacterium]